MKRNRLKLHLIIQIVIFAFAVFTDQLTKLVITKIFPEPDPSEDIVVIRGLLEFTYIRNSGASFGIFQNKMVLFYIITIIVLAAIIFFMAVIYKKLSDYYTMCRLTVGKYRRRTPRGMIFLCYVLSVLAGGAVGNFIDRIRLGYVVDFIDLLILKIPSFSGGFHWESFPIFNLADVYVTFSAIVLFVYLLFIYKEDENLSLFKKK